MSQCIWFSGRTAGCWKFRCEGRHYQIRKGDAGWEIAIRDDLGDFILSSGATPEGVFKTLRAARRALLAFIDDHPVPKLVISAPEEVQS